MSTIDERVVAMKFDNAQFERGVQSTLAKLDALNSKLRLEGASKGLNEVNNASKNVKLDHIKSSVDAVANRFKAMEVVAVTALATVVHNAVSAGGRLIKSLTLDPVIQGFKEYEIQINAIQTILANTAHAGTNLKQVNAALAELNEYSDKTIYNFSEMAKNIGTFTAAGVSLETATAAIKGIANLAAVSGSNSQQASAAMYQLSQALAAGRVTLEDWNSVVNAGMGGKVFQDALVETARVHGVAIDQMLKDEGSFRLTLQKGWLTGDILNETLMKFTGDLNASQLKSMGYSKQQIAEILKMGKIAQNAATEVKTMSQLISTLQEAVGSGWAKTWQLIFGDFEEAKSLFTNVSNVLGGFIERSSEARNKVLTDWKALGGRKVLIDAVSNSFTALTSVLKPIGEAFREVFPPMTGQRLFDLTVKLRDFTEKLKIGSETASKIKRIFVGFFSIFGIAFDAIKRTGEVIAEFFGILSGGSGGFLEIIARVGDFVVGLREAINESEVLSTAFDFLRGAFAVPIQFVKELIKQFDNLFGKISGSEAADGIKSFADTFKGLLNPQNLFGAISGGALVGIFLQIKKVADMFVGEGSIFDSVKDSFDQLTDTLGAMQNVLRAATLIQIALAVGILALAVDKLAKIDADGLTRASVTIAGLFTQLAAAMLIFEKFSGFVGFLKMPFVASSMILLAIAVDILASAVKKLAGFSWEELGVGLTGLTGILALLIGTVKLMPSSKSLVLTSLGLVVLASAVKILVSSVKDLSGLGWEELAKGLVGVGSLLGSLILFTKFAQANKGGVLQGAGIILLAAGIKILASAMKYLGGLSWGEIARGLTALGGALAEIGLALTLIPPTAVLSAAGVFVVAASLGMIGDALNSMGGMKWGEIGKGIVALAGALTVIGLALTFIPPTAPLIAAGILVVAISLGLIANALQDMATMSWGEIAKGLVALAGSLGIIAVAMAAMTTALPGAAALFIVSAALNVLAPVLLKFGQMSIGEIVKSLLMLAGVFAVIGAAGVILTPLVPTLISLGGAISLIGLGALLAGAGVLLFATALKALAASGVAGAQAMVGVVTIFATALPKIITAVAVSMAASGPAMIKALTVILLSLIKSIDTVSPKIITTLFKMLSKMLDTMEKHVPKMTDTGLKLLIGVLNGISKNIDRVVDSATKVVVGFINAISRNLPKVTQAGANMIIKFINSVANTIRSNSEAMGQAGANLASAIIEGMARGLIAGIGTIAAKAREVARSALDAAKSALGIHSPSKEFEKIGKYVNQGFAKGLTGSKDEVYRAYDELKNLLKDALNSSNEDIKSAEEKLKKLTSARHRDNAAIEKARKALAQARKEHKAEAAAYTSLMSSRFKNERAKLAKLATQYDGVTEKLKEAQDALNDAVKTRDDFKKSITDQYSDLPDISSDTKLNDYVDGLKKQIADTATFTNAIQRLRDLGLNDAMYRELLAKGTSALPFIKELLAGGKDSVDQINQLDKQLEGIAGSLGNNASTTLYQAAVDSAAGLVAGLEKQQSAIKKMMDKIADAMVDAINKKLNAATKKKPKKKKGSVKIISAVSSTNTSDDNDPNPGTAKIYAVETSEISRAINDEVAKSNPTVTPVLDLTNVKNDAAQIQSLFSKTTISVEVAYKDANQISSSIRNGNTQDETGSANAASSSVVYNQYNNSPKALSSAEIYRQTKNQLSVAKGALATNAN